MEALTEGPHIPSSSEGGRCGLEEGLEDCFRELARAGGGRFHHFRASGSCDSDDILDLREEMARAFEYLEEGRRILDDYRVFCRRVSVAKKGVCSFLNHLSVCRTFSPLLQILRLS